MNLSEKQQKLLKKIFLLLKEKPIGMRLQSERDLSESLRVSRAMLRKVLKYLEDRKIILIKPGSGIFINKTLSENNNHIMSFTNKIKQQGMLPTSKIIDRKVLEASLKIANTLKIEPQSKVFFLKRLRYANKIPMAIESVYLPVKYYQELNLDSLKFGSLYSQLKEQYNIDIKASNQKIGATILNQEEASFFQIPAFTPATIIKRVVVDYQDNIVEYSKGIYPASRFYFNMEIQNSDITFTPYYETYNDKM